MASTAPGARSNEGSGSAGAQLNRRNDSEKPSAGKNKVLPSPSRAHDPRKTQLKLPPGAAPVTGNKHAVNSAALDFVDTILDPNLEAYKKKDRSRSITPPGSPWGEMEPELTAAENAAVNNTKGSDPEGSWTEVVKGNRQGSQWPKPNHTNLSAKGAPKKSAARGVKNKVPAAFNRSELREGLGADGEALIHSEGIVSDAHSALAEYAKTTISAEHIDKNSALKKLENPLEGVSNEQVTHSDMRLFVEAVVKPNPLLPHTQLKDLKIPKNFKPFVKSLSALVDKKANMGTSNAFQITQAGIKKDKGIPVYLYSIGLTSMEGKVNLLAYKWAPNDLIFKYFVEFREVVSKEIPGVWFRLALAQTAANQHDPPPLSQYIQCLMEAGLEESDIIGDFSMGSKPDVEGFSVSKVFEPFLYFKLKPEACEGHGSDEHVIFTGEDGVATHTDIPAVNIYYPPPRIVIIDCNGDVHVRDLQKLGDFCKYCCGSGRCVKCLYFGRCRACLVLYADMKDKGRRHFCVEGIESIPKHPKRENVTLDLHPTRVTSKRQKLQDKIKSSGAGDKVMEEIRKKLAAYKKKEEGEI